MQISSAFDRRNRYLSILWRGTSTMGTEISVSLAGFIDNRGLKGSDVFKRDWGRDIKTNCVGQ